MENIFELEANESSEYYFEEQKFETEQIEGFKYGLKKYKNIYLPNMIRNVEIVQSLDVRPDDTFVIGYPKSGTTWTEELVWLIQNNLDYQRAKSEFHFFRVMYIDRGYSQKFLEHIKPPRVFKSHLPFDLLPTNIEKTSKIVYVIRNPKDVCASSYNFLKSLKTDEFTGSFEKMVNNFLEGKFWFGSWWDHVDRYATIPEVFIIRYEELLEKPFETIKNMIEYLGKSYTDSEIHDLISFCSFDKMKEYKSFDIMSVDKQRFFHENLNFFRKGQIGNWKKYMSDELAKKFDELIEKNLKHGKNLKYLPSNKTNS